MKRVSIVMMNHPDASMSHLYLHGLRKDSLKHALPGGSANEGETDNEAAVRELKEETGLDLHPKDLKHIRSEQFNKASGPVMVTMFQAQCPKEHLFDKTQDPDKEFQSFSFINPLKNQSLHVPAQDNLLVKHLTNTPEVKQRYYEKPDDGKTLALMYPVSIGGKSEIAPGFPMHITIKAFKNDGGPEHAEVEDVLRAIANDNLNPPELSALKFKADQLKDYKVLRIEGMGPNHIQMHDHLRGLGVEFPEFKPHITIPDELHAKLKGKKLDAKSLRMKVGPLELRRGNQILHRFDPTKLPEQPQRIPGGKAKKLDPKLFDSKQLKAGVKVELEHTMDKRIALEIAMDHLTEDPKYYEKLKAVHLDKSEVLNKGAPQRLWPYNPETDTSDNEKHDTHDWTYSTGAGSEVRNAVPALKEYARKRAIRKLHKLTQSRKNPLTNETEFLLHRGTSPHEDINQYEKEGNKSSWTPKISVADAFGAGAKDWSDKKQNDIYGKTHSAWIPEKHIHSVPNYFGPKGNNPYQMKEQEVIVKPHKLQMASPEDMAQLKTKEAHWSDNPMDTGRRLEHGLSLKEVLPNTPFKYKAGFKKTEELAKAPSIYDPGDDVRDPMGPIKSMKKLSSTKLPNGLIHNAYESKTDPGYFTHDLVHPLNPKMALARMHVVNETPDPDYPDEEAPTVKRSIVNHNFRGHKFGKQLYLAALSHHGYLESDSSVSPNAHKVWQSMSKVPNVDVELAPYGEGAEYDEWRHKGAAIKDIRGQKRSFPKVKPGVVTKPDKTQYRSGAPKKKISVSKSEPLDKALPPVGKLPSQMPPPLPRQGPKPQLTRPQQPPPLPQKFVPKPLSATKLSPPAKTTEGPFLAYVPSSNLMHPGNTDQSLNTEWDAYYTGPGKPYSHNSSDAMRFGTQSALMNHLKSQPHVPGKSIPHEAHAITTLDPHWEESARVGNHPNSYDWHDGHTDHHILKKADTFPHTQAHGPKNTQAAGAGVATYKDIASQYGQVNPGTKTDLTHYKGLEQFEPKIDKMIVKEGYKTYMAGGKYGKPDRANKNYNTKHLMIYDPTPGSGGTFDDERFTRSWRKIHELAHALTYPEINKIYGEGRRLGKLGVRTPKEAKRAVHWEHLAANKQRELASKMGMNIPESAFNKEYNTVMHDAVHRAIHGTFTEPSEEGFNPSSKQTSLAHSLKAIDEHAKKIGLGHENATRMSKNEELSKAPTVTSEKYADEWASQSAVADPQYDKHIQTKPLSNNMYHHIFDIRSGGPYFGAEERHILSNDPNPHAPGLAHMITGTKWPTNKTGASQVYGVAVDPKFKNKGYGKQIYSAVLNHYGKLISGPNVSAKAHTTWEHMATDPKIKVKLEPYGSKFADKFHSASIKKRPTLGKSEDQPVHLVHFSHTPNLQTIDPKHMGNKRGFGGAELKQGIPETPWMHYYRAGTPYEANVASAPHKYEATLQPHQKLYDMATDPANIISDTIKGNNGAYNRDKVLGAIKAAGYHGFHHSGGGLPGAVGLFHAQKVNQVQKAEQITNRHIRPSKDQTSAAKTLHGQPNKTFGLHKGAPQRLFPTKHGIVPNAEADPDVLDTRAWVSGVTPADQSRELLPKMKGHERSRTMRKLLSLAHSRVNPKTNEREFLLHRGHHADDNTQSAFDNGRRTSWTPDQQVAVDFARSVRTNLGDKEPIGQVTSSWVPEQHIVSMPKYQMLGSTKHSRENEVIVEPHNFNVHDTGEWHNFTDRQSPANINESISRNQEGGAAGTRSRFGFKKSNSYFRSLKKTS